MAMHRQGFLVGAETACRQVLVVAPAHLDTMQLLGVIEFQKGNFAAAADLLQRAAAKAPREPGLLCNLGLALQALGRLEEALVCQERALALRPTAVEAHNNRGNVLRALGRMEEAAGCYREALRRRPDFVEARVNLATVLIAKAQPESALEHLERCLEQAPGHASALGQRAIALLALGRPAEALTSLDALAAAGPGDAETHYWRGNALISLGRAEEAAVSYRLAIRLRPGVAEAHYNLGNALLEAGRHDEAIAAFDEALALRPAYAAALYNRGSALQESGRYADAAMTFERLLAVAGDHRYARGKLAHCRRFCGDWKNYRDDVEVLVAGVAAGQARDMPFPFLSVSPDPALQLACARAFAAARYSLPPLRTARLAGRGRIRIAYVSADFREHALSYLLAGVFEAHDRGRFEVLGVSLRPAEDSPTGRRVVAAFDRFIDISAMGDEAAAGALRELALDIAVDLTGYTDENRTALFARRIAPVQVNYLGFPATMGAPFMDYIVGDDFVIPEASRQHYQEQVAYLPECFQGNDDRRPVTPPGGGRRDWGLPETGFVFCAFNNTYKLSPEFFALWMRLLLATPGSVLWLAADDGEFRRNLAAEAERHGVVPDRLVFSPRVPYVEHLARLGLADLFLDTLPFNAGTTASDALWAGLPVLTCPGEAFAARMAGSLLRAIGLPELIAADLADYEAKARALAADANALGRLRARLAENRRSAPLFDTRRFCRHLEAAYGVMAERSRRGEAPATFRVEALPPAGNPEESDLR